MGEGLGGGRPWMATVVALEARGNLLVEGRGKAVGWGWRRMVWRCSPGREVDQDGLGEEIDGVALFLVKNRGERNWSEEKDERRSGTARRARGWRGEQPEACFYRHWRVVGRQA